jgi:hypothetical protein
MTSCFPLYPVYREPNLALLVSAFLQVTNGVLVPVPPFNPSMAQDLLLLMAHAFRRGGSYRIFQNFLYGGILRFNANNNNNAHDGAQNQAAAHSDSDSDDGQGPGQGA